MEHCGKTAVQKLTEEGFFRQFQPVECD